MSEKKLTAFAALLTSLALAPLAWSEVPTYRVEVIDELTTSTFMTNASDAGQIVGWQVTIDGEVRGFVAELGRGVTILPLPDGYLSSTALDVNSSGVIVGAVHTSSFVYDGGVPAIWVPDGNGGYTMHIPQQFATMSGPFGMMPINGGMAVAINDAGLVVGWSRFQGFQGGPSTLFSISDPPVDLRTLGLEDTVTDINNNNVVLGGEMYVDLDTGAVTDMGTPPPLNGLGFNFAIGYSINDNNQVVAAGRRSTSTADRWLTLVHDEGSGWRMLNPSQIATPNTGFYDNNDRDDIAAIGGRLFADENVLVSSYQSLLAPEHSGWTFTTSHIANDRRVYASGYYAATDTYALVVLVPDTGCAADLTNDGELNFFDVAAFLDGFAAGDPAMDFAADGVLDFFDVSEFLALFASGCP